MGIIKCKKVRYENSLTNLTNNCHPSSDTASPECPAVSLRVFHTDN